LETFKVYKHIPLLHGTHLTTHENNVWVTIQQVNRKGTRPVITSVELHSTAPLPSEWPSGLPEAEIKHEPETEWTQLDFGSVLPWPSEPTWGQQVEAMKEWAEVRRKTVPRAGQQQIELFDQTVHVPQKQEVLQEAALPEFDQVPHY
jgi:hypothetical protein